MALFALFGLDGDDAEAAALAAFGAPDGVAAVLTPRLTLAQSASAFRRSAML